MKYRMSERMTVFDTIEEARKYFCIANACSDCCLDCSQDKRYSSCREYCAKHPEKAAKLMGYEVIKEEELMNKQDKPRICEVLGVEVGERFTINRKDSPARYVISSTGYVILDGSGEGISGTDLANIINHPESIVRRKRFTEQEIEDAKAIKRILPNMQAVRRNGIGALCISGSRCEYLSFLANSLFPSIAPGESYTLDEIIGEG